MTLLRRLSIACLLLAACYSPSIPNGKQECGTSHNCPTGYSCAPDNHCYKNGQLPSGTVDMAMAVDAAMATCTAASCKGGPKPICDSSGACVECLTDPDCPSGKICTAKACLPGCTGSHGCPDGGGMCDPNAKMCKRCMVDGDCGGGTPRCDTNSGECAACLPANDNCPIGHFCNLVNGVYTCQMGCQKDGDCLPTTDGGMQQLACCNHVCIDKASDGANCGGCGILCGGEACCAGICSDTKTDLTNCGGCGNGCTGLHAQWSCAMAMCAVTSCANGFGDCNGSSNDGCEATLAADPKNCSACGMKCSAANAVAGCMMSACTIAMCNAGFGDCNKTYGDGCEVNISGDTNNCGACNAKCAPANATGACVASTCVVAMCNPNFGDCDNLSANGCETPTLNDINNCGGCNIKCGALPNATGSCSNAKCVIGTCTAGYKDCDNNPLDGCESQSAIDPNNCGGCGIKCTPGANVAAESCANSACTITACNAGFANCNGAVGDGCEINTNTDKNNCGMCGKVCMNCMNGVCGMGCNNTVLVLADADAANSQALVTTLNGAGMNATLFTSVTTYAGVPAAGNFSAVVILVGDTFATDMPLAGQQSIVNAAAGSTGVVFFEWGAYHVSTMQWVTLAPLLLLQRTGATAQGALTYTLVMNHPVWSGVPASFTFAQAFASANTGPLVNGGVAVATCTQSASPSVAIRDGNSRIVEDAAATDWSTDTAWLTDANRKQLIINYAKWATHCM